MFGWLRRKFSRRPAREDITDLGFGVVPDPGLANANWFRQWVGIYQLVDRLARARGGVVTERPLDERMIYIARGLMRYNSYAQGFVSGLRGHVLGANGLVHHATGPSAGDLQTWLDAWKDRVDWWSWEREIYERVHVEGESFTRFFPDDGDVCIRPIEPEWVVAPDGTEEWTFGLHNVSGDVHDIDMLHTLYGTEDEEVDAHDFYHIKSKLSVRADKRGRSDFLPCAALLDDSFKTWRNFAAAEAVRQATVYYTEQPEGVTVDDMAQAVAAQADYTPPPAARTGRAQPPVRLVQGVGVEHLQAGTKLAAVPGAANVQATMAGVNAALLAVGRPYHMPLVLITGDMGANNTMDFGDESPFSVQVTDESRWYCRHIRNLLWRVVQHAVDEGALPARVLTDGTNLEVTGERKPARDAEKNTARAKTLYDDGVISGRERSTMEGVDYDEQQAARQREGLPTLPQKAQQQPAPQQVTEDAGLVEREVTVHRGGKTFQRKQRVREGGDAPAQEHPHGHDTSDVPEGLRARARALAKRAVQAARELAVRLTPAAMRVGQALGAVLDTPEDMKKFGYNPTTSSGTAHAGGPDPVRAAITDALGVGVSGHVVASVVAYALSHAIAYVKGRLRGDTHESADPAVMEFAELVHELYARTMRGMGGNVPGAEAIAARIAELLG